VLDSWNNVIGFVGAPARVAACNRWAITTNQAPEATATAAYSAVQGYEVWGENGFPKLWSAANLKIYGGGVSDEPWLRELSNLIGPHDVSAGHRAPGVAARRGHRPGAANRSSASPS